MFLQRIKLHREQIQKPTVNYIKLPDINFFMDEIAKQVESLLFASGRKMSIDELKVLVGTNSNQIMSDALKELQEYYKAKETALMVVDEGDCWKLTTREHYLPLVRKVNPNTELSKSIMETLAVIAWKQPIMQSEVINIRTNKAYEHITDLERMGFLVKEKYGRTFLLKLSQKFYDYFDLEGEKQARELFKKFKEQGTEQKRVNEFEEIAVTEQRAEEPLVEEKLQEEVIREEIQNEQKAIEEEIQEGNENNNPEKQGEQTEEKVIE